MSSKNSKKVTKAANFNNADLNKYVKKYKAMSKKKTIIGVTAAALILAGGAGIGGYFISKAKYNQNQDGIVYIDPSKQKDADVSYITTSEGDKVATVSSEKSGKIISSVEVTIGGVPLTEGTEYVIEKFTSNGGNHCQVRIKKEALEKHSGVVYVAPIFEEEVAVVVFNSNGGTSVNVKQVKIGSKFKKPDDPTKDNYDFGGWYLDEELTEEFKFNETTGESVKPVTETINLYAKWNIPEVKKGILSYEFNVNANGYYVYCKDKTKLPAYLRIPEKYDNHDVIGIGLPDSSKMKLEDNEHPFLGAFSYATKLVEVVIPKTVKWVDKYAFTDCYSLKKVTFEGETDSIGYGAFSYCKSLNEINLHEGLLSLGTDAFYGCSSLSSIKLPNTLLSIPDGCFGNCSALSSVELGQKVAKIGNGETLWTDNLNKDALLKEYAKETLKIRNAVIEEQQGTVINIGGNVFYDEAKVNTGAFEGCSALRQINIPASVTNIAYNAFKGCYSLDADTFIFEDSYSPWFYYYTDSKQYLPTTEMIIDFLLKGSSSLYKDAFVVANQKYLEWQYAGEETDENGNTTYYCTIGLNAENIGELPEGYGATITIPDTVSYNGKEFVVYKIADDGFNYRKMGNPENPKAQNRYNFVLPSTIKYIGDRSFYAVCNFIDSINFEENKSNLISIGDYAFTECLISRFNADIDDTNHINIPEKTRRIGYNAFSILRAPGGIDPRGDKLHVTIPASVEDIPTQLVSSSYLNLDTQERSTIKNATYIFGYPFFGSSVKKIDVAPGNLYYLSKDGNLYSKVTVNGESTPSELISCTNFAEDGSYVIENGTTSINDVAFMNCYCYNTNSKNEESKPLKKLKFSNQMENVKNCFYYHKKYMMYFNSNPQSDADYANDVYSLREIETNNNYKFDADKVLYGDIDDNNIPRTLITSLNYAKNTKTSIYKVPYTIRTISNGAFMCNGYDNETLSIPADTDENPSQLESIGAYAFAYNNDNFGSLYKDVPVGNTATYRYNFEGIYVPKTVKTIGAYVFQGTGVLNLYIHNSQIANTTASTFMEYYTGTSSNIMILSPYIYVKNDVIVSSDSFIKTYYGKTPVEEPSYYKYTRADGAK